MREIGDQLAAPRPGGFAIIARMPDRTDVYRIDFAGDAEDRCVLVIRDGERPWTLRVDATNGHPALLPRGVLHVLGDLLLLLTEGEHRRSGAAFRPQIHRVSPEGALLWSLRARCVGEPLRLGDHLLLPVRLARSRFAPDDPADLHLQVRDAATGALLATYPVRPPPALERAYAHALAGVGARLLAHGDAVQVSVSAWFTGPNAPPRGAGSYDVTIAL